MKPEKYFIADLVDRTIVAQNLTLSEQQKLYLSLAPTEYERRRYARFNYDTLTPKQFLK